MLPDVPFNAVVFVVFSGSGNCAAVVSCKTGSVVTGGDIIISVCTYMRCSKVSK